MPRVVIAALLAQAALSAAVLPEAIGPNTKRAAVEPIAVSDRAVWDEYGLTDAERAKYATPPMTVSAWRLKDPTGSQAAFRWMRPANAGPGNKDQLTYGKFAVTAGNGGMMVFGNYLLQFEGRNPTLDELKLLLFQLPKVDQSALPPVLGFLPKDAPVPGTERYVLGPASLEKFYPKVSPSTAGFHFGSEAHIARYKQKSSELEMALFYYPTNQMAQKQLPEFQKIEGALVKRTGPLIAVVISPANADDAERLLAQVDYKANITMSEGPPGGEVRQAGSLILTAIYFAGGLAAVAILGGFMMYGMRYLRRRAAGGSDDPMTRLHLGDR